MSVTSAIHRYSNHSSIIIQERFQSLDTNFDFSRITKSSMLKALNELNESKAISGQV